LKAFHRSTCKKPGKTLRALYHEIWRRLRSQNIDISCLHPSILPFLPTSHKHSDWWRRLLLEPLLVSDDELKRLFKLTESVTNTLRPSLPRQTLYARSYKLKVKHLRYIIAKWEFQGRYYNESIVWVKMTDSLDPGDFVFIRYIRIIHRTGIQRCFEDNKNRTFGLLPAFLRSLDDLFESRQEPCTCYEFVDGSLEDVDSTGAGDLKKKSLVALFVHPSLLNKQHGGFSTTTFLRTARNHYSCPWRQMHSSC